jgi:hypothetical protein
LNQICASGSGRQKRANFRGIRGNWDSEKMALFMGKILFSAREEKCVCENRESFSGAPYIFLTEGKLEH